MPLPKVSCLLVLPDRRASATGHAVEDFLAQTYASCQLVVAVAPGDEAGRRDAVRAAGRDDPRVVIVASADPAAAHEAADGDLICRWSPTTRHHPRRLADQVAALDGAAAGVALTSQVHVHATRRVAAWIDHRHGAPNGAGGLVASTLIACRRHVPPDRATLDDMTLFQAVAALGPIARVDDRAYLSCPVHRGNTRDFYALARRHGLDADAAARRRHLLLAHLPEVDWPFATLAVCDRDGVDRFTIAT